MKVNGKDDIPYTMENKSHVPNQQPDYDRRDDDLLNGSSQSTDLAYAVWGVAGTISNHEVVVDLPL